MKLSLTVTLALGALAIAACGGSDSTDPAPSVSVKFKQELPSLPIADEGISTGIRLIDSDGSEVYNEDFWKLPAGNANETMDTVTYDLDEMVLTPGVYEIDAVIRACNASGCSAEDLGKTMVHCHASPGIDMDSQVTVVYKDREQAAGCGFAIQSS